MATSRIKIEVDFDNAVAKIDQLKVGFREIGERTVEARDRILKMVTATKVAAEGSVKALQREKAAWQQIQASLSTTNQEYRKYQVQIDALDKQIDKITDTRKREEIALKNSANGIRQQIALIQQEMENRKLSNTQYRVMNEEVAKLEARLQALTDTRQKHQIVQRGSIADFDQQIAALREEQRNTALSAEQVERYEQDIESLRLKKRALTNETKSLDKASQSFSSSAGASGAAVTEFGRVIGDAPFGLIGITNNIQQLSQQFTDLRNKSGGTREAFKSFMGTLMGPAGFVVAINVVTSAVLALQMRKQKLNKETEKINETMLTEGKTLQSLITLYYQLNEASEERAKIIGALAQSDNLLADALKKAGSDEKERAKITEEYMRLRLASNQADDKRSKIAEKHKDILKQELMTQEQIFEEQDRINSLTDPEEAAIESSLLQERIKDNNKLKGVLSELAAATLEYSDAQKDLKDSLGATKTAQEQHAEAIKDVDRQVAEDQQILQSDQLKKRKEFLSEDIKATKENSDERYKLSADLYKLDAEISKALAAERKEAAEKEKERQDELAEKEKERLESLKELNQQYIDDLEVQFDEYGLLRVNQQERQAIDEAKALGASVGVLLNIRKYYEGERQKIINKATEELEENNKKSTEKRAKELQETLKEQFETEIESMKSQVEMMSEVFSNFGNILDELGNISQSRFDRQVGLLKEQRDIIRTNDALTKEEKEQQLTDLQRKENEIQRKRIKAERNMFTLKQAIVLAEMVLKQKAFVQEQIMMQKMTVALAKQATTSIQLTAAEEMGEAGMSIGTFMKELGPWGIAAFALSIGGVIASIVSARRKASAEIAGLSDAPISLGGGGGGASAPAVPSFNVVGASAQNQLAAAIAGQQSEPVRAYVVSSDVSTAQELDRKIVEGASI